MSSRWERFWERMLPLGARAPHRRQLRLFAPALRHAVLTSTSYDPDTGDGRYDHWGWVPSRDAYHWAILDTHPVVRLPLSAPPVLVSNDFFAAPSQFTDSPPVPIPLPRDVDPYDGKTWRVHAPSAAIAGALLDAETWQSLERLGERHRFTVWLDGEHVVGDPSVSLGLAQEVAALVTRRWEAGALADWPAGPDPSLLPDLGKLFGTDWDLHPAPRAMNFGAGGLVPGHYFDAEVTGSVDGHRFRALRQSGDAGTGAPLWAPPSRGVPPPGVVLLPLERAVGTRVRYVRDPRVLRGNVHTEWLDFDESFAVTASDEEQGHALTTPRLMQYLYDHQVPRLDIVGDDLALRVRRFEAGAITDAVRMLIGARELLPRFEPDDTQS